MTDSLWGGPHLLVGCLSSSRYNKEPRQTSYARLCYDGCSMGAEQEVLEANDRFYQALTELDAGAMEEIWLREAWVRCVHPGWQMLSGWDEVLESWRQIFANTMSHRVEASDVTVRLFGELAWVLCLERIVGSPESGTPVSFAQGTNLFVETPSGWRMILHHASVVPVELPPETSSTVH